MRGRGRRLGSGKSERRGGEEHEDEENLIEKETTDIITGRLSV